MVALLEWDAPAPGTLELDDLAWIHGRVVDRVTLYRKITRGEYQILRPCLLDGQWRMDGGGWQPANTLHEAMAV